MGLYLSHLKSIASAGIRHSAFTAMGESSSVSSFFQILRFDLVEEQVISRVSVVISIISYLLNIKHLLYLFYTPHVGSPASLKTEITD